MFKINKIIHISIALVGLLLVLNSFESVVYADILGPDGAKGSIEKANGKKDSKSDKKESADKSEKKPTIDDSKKYNSKDLDNEKSKKFLINPNSKINGGADNGLKNNKKAIFYWNKNNIIASHKILQELDIDSCDNVTKLNYGEVKTKFNNNADKYNNYLVNCVKKQIGGKFKEDFSSYKSESSDVIYLKNQIVSPNNESKIYCSYENDAPAPRYNGRAGVSNNPSKTVSNTIHYKPSCKASFLSEKITEFWPVNINNDEVIYYADSVHQIRDDLSADIRYHNGVITNINMSKNGDIGLTFNGMKHDSSSDVIGDPAKSWQENFFYNKTNQQYNSLLSKYQKTCQKNSSNSADCTGEDSKQTFSHIWMKCVIATGSPEEDVLNANTCLKNNAGIELNEKTISKDAPKDDDILEQKNSCNIKSGGFIICPLISFFSFVADNIYKLIDPMLQIKPIDYNSKSLDNIDKLSASEKNKVKGGIIAYQAWKIFTSIANAIFVLFFLVIIFSQMTNIGISNYGIKKLLPKIIIGAILLNMSFFICSTLIDISNIIGSSLKSLLDSINDTAVKNAAFTTDFTSDGGSVWSEIGDNLLLVSGGGLGLVAGAVAIYYAFLPIVTSVVFAIVAFIIFLFVRYSLVIVLILISPLAFVCFLLPNTKKWFTKWYTVYIGLLMIYPVVSIVFGMSTLAANIIASSADSDNSQTLMMFALSVQAIPLVIIPFITKKIQQITGNMGTAKVGGEIKGFFDGLAKRRQGRWNNKSKAAALRGSKFIPGAKTIRLGAKLKKASSYRQRNQAKVNQEYIENIANDNRQTLFGNSTKGERYSKRVLGSSPDAQAHFNNYIANAVIDEDFLNNINVERKKLKENGIDDAAQIERKIGGILNSSLTDPENEATILAGLESLIEKINQGSDSESIDAIERLLSSNNFNNLSDIARMHLAEKVATSNNPILGVEAARNIRHKKNQINFDEDVILPGLENVSANDLANMNGKHLSSVVRALANSNNQALIDSVKERAREALNNPKVRSSYRDSETENQLKQILSLP